VDPYEESLPPYIPHSPWHAGSSSTTNFFCVRISFFLCGLEILSPSYTPPPRAMAFFKVSCAHDFYPSPLVFDPNSVFQARRFFRTGCDKIPRPHVESLSLALLCRQAFLLRPRSPPCRASAFPTVRCFGVVKAYVQTLGRTALFSDADEAMVPPEPTPCAKTDLKEL